MIDFGGEDCKMREKMVETEARKKKYYEGDTFRFS
jgi:hypothetical protein